MEAITLPLVTFAFLLWLAQGGLRRCQPRGERAIVAIGSGLSGLLLAACVAGGWFLWQGGGNEVAVIVGVLATGGSLGALVLAAGLAGIYACALGMKWRHAFCIALCELAAFGVAWGVPTLLWSMGDRLLH